MLVLSRRRGESIVIADNIEVTIIDVRKNRVRLGFSAPATVNIHREELTAERTVHAEAPEVAIECHTG